MQTYSEQIEEIKLSYNDLQDEDVKPLLPVIKVCPNLKGIALSENNLSKKLIAEVNTMTSLAWVKHYLTTILNAKQIEYHWKIIDVPFECIERLAKFLKVHPDQIIELPNFLEDQKIIKLIAEAIDEELILYIQNLACRFLAISRFMLHLHHSEAPALTFDLMLKILYYLDIEVLLTKEQIFAVVAYAKDKKTLGKTREEFLNTTNCKRFSNLEKFWHKGKPDNTDNSSNDKLTLAINRLRKT